MLARINAILLELDAEIIRSEALEQLMIAGEGIRRRPNTVCLALTSYSLLIP